MKMLALHPVLFLNQISGKKMLLEPYTLFIGLDAFKLHVPIKITENEDSRDLHRSRGLLSRKALWFLYCREEKW